MKKITLIDKVIYSLCALLCFIVEPSLTIYARFISPYIIHELYSPFTEIILFMLVNALFSALFAYTIANKKALKFILYGGISYGLLDFYQYQIAPEYVLNISSMYFLNGELWMKKWILVTFLMYYSTPFFQLIPFLFRIRTIKLYIKPLLLSFGISFGLGIVFHSILAFSNYLGYDNLPEFISPWGYPINLQRIHYYIDMLLILKSLRLVSKEVASNQPSRIE